MSNKTLNPFTGLPLEEDSTTNPWTGLTNLKSNPSYEARMGSEVAGVYDYNDFLYDDGSPKAAINPYVDMEEIRARNQSVGEAWKNGLAKAGATALGAFAENTLGYGLGLVDYATSDKSFTEAMIDNPVGKYVDQMNAAMREQYPNYDTEQQRKERGTWASAGNANFWADSFMNGLAYSAGTAATMFVLPGGLVGGAAKAIGSTALNSLRATKMIQNGKTLKNIIDTQGKFANATNKVISGAGFIESGVAGSIAESNVEARGIETEVIRDLKDAYMMQNGLDKESDIPYEIIDEINKAGDVAKKAGFFGNMAVLTATNLLIFKNILNPGKVGRHATKGTGLPGDKVVMQGLGKRTGKELLNTAGGGTLESVQEVSQYGITETLKEQAVASFNDTGNLDAFNALYSGSTLSQIGELAPGTGEKIKGLYTEGDKHGREQAAIGFLVGALTRGFGGFVAGPNTMRKRTKRTQELVDHMNSSDSFFNIANRAEANKRNSEYIKMAQSSDPQTAAKGREKLLNSELAFHGTNGTLDYFGERISDLESLSPDEYAKAIDADPNTMTAEKQSEQIKKIKAQQKAAVKTKERIDALFPNRQGPLGKLNVSKAAKNKRLQEKIDDAIYKNALFESSLGLSNVDNNIISIFEAIQQAAPEANLESLKSAISSYRKAYGDVVYEGDLTDSKKTKKTIERHDDVVEQINKARQEIYTNVTDLLLVDELNLKLSELYDNVVERNDAVASYLDLTKSPEARSLYLSRKGQERKVEEAKEADNRVKSLIESTDTSQELKAQQLDLASAPNIAKETRQKLKQEILTREEEENKADEEFGYLTKTQVENIKPDSHSKLQEAARKEHIKNRTQEEPLRARPVMSKKRTKRKANTKSTTGQSSDPVSTPKPGEGRRSTGAAQALFDQGKSTPSLSTRTSSPVLSGQFSLAPNPKDPKSPFVIVDEAGNPEEGLRQDGHYDENGDPIITHRELLNDPKIGPGTKVRLRVREDNTWWQTEGKDKAKGNAAQTVPIYVEVQDPVNAIEGQQPAAPTKEPTKFTVPELTSEQERLAQLEETLKETDKNTLSLMREKGMSAEKIEKFILRNAGKTSAGNNLLADFQMEDILNNPQEYSEALLVNAMRRRMFGDTPIGSGNAETETREQIERIKQDIQEGKTFNVNFTTEESLTKTLMTDGRRVGFQGGEYAYGNIGSKRLAYEALVDLGILESTTQPTSEVADDVAGEWKTVGVLGRGLNVLRQNAWKEALKGNPTAIETTISKKHANNIFSAVEELDNNTVRRHFYNPAEELDIEAIAIVKSEEGLLRWEMDNLTPTETLTESDITQMRRNLGESPMTNLVAGQVAVIVRTPTGKFFPVIASTSNLNAADQKIAFAAMAEGNIKTLEEFIAVNQYIADESDDRSDRTLLFDETKNGLKLFAFSILNDKGVQEDLLDIPEGSLIRVPVALINKAFNGEELTLKDLSAVEKENLIVAVESREDGPPNLTGISKQISNDALELIVQSLGIRISQLLKNKKYQVNSSNINTNQAFEDPTNSEIGYPSYLDYLTSEENHSNDNKNGHTGILSTTAKNVDGSPFIDIGLDLGGEIEVSGQKSSIEELAKAMPEIKTPITKGAKTTEAEKTNRRGKGKEKKSNLKRTRDKSKKKEKASLAETLSEETQGDVVFEESLSNDQMQQAALRDTALYMKSVGASNEQIRRDTGYTGPLRARPPRRGSRRISKAEATAWLKERGMSSTFFDNLGQVEGDNIHGMWTEAGIKLWSNAEIGTEYHEAFHDVKRSLLSDKQNKALYEEEVALNGEATNDELRKVSQENPEVTDEQELKDLAIEERLSEEFRNVMLNDGVVPKTLGAKVSKFFKDMFAFLKALVGGRITKDQTYALIDSRYFGLRSNTLRTVMQRRGKKNSYRSYVNPKSIVPGWESDPEIYEAGVNSVGSQFVFHVQKLEAELERRLTPKELGELIGERDNKGIIAEWFLTRAYSDANGDPLSLEELKTISELYDSNIEAWESYLEENDIYNEPSEDLISNLDFAKVATDDISHIFQEMYSNWGDTVTGENVKRGWRYVMLKYAKERGYRFAISDETVIEDELAEYEKIYNLDTYEVDPAQKNSEIVTRWLSTIINPEVNILGLKDFIQADKVYKQFKATTSGAKNMVQIVEKLGQAVQNKQNSVLLPVFRALKNSSVKDLAAIQRAMVNHYRPFVIHKHVYDTTKIEIVDENDKLTKTELTSMSAQLVSADRGAVSKYMYDKWKRNSTFKGVVRENSVFENVERKEDDGSTSSYLIFNNNKVAGKSRYKHLEDSVKIYRDPKLSNEERIGALSDALWFMSIELGESREDSALALSEFLTKAAETQFEKLEGDTPLEILISDEIKNFLTRHNIFSMLKGITNAKGQKGSISMSAPKQKVVNIFIKESNNIQNIAEEVVKLSTVSEALPFLDTNGLIHPYNDPSALSDLFEDYTREDGVYAERLNILKKDPTFFVPNHPEYNSIGFELMENPSFKMKYKNLAHVRGENEESKATAFSKFNRRLDLQTRLNEYANGGSAEAFYAVPTLEGRQQLPFFSMPRFSEVGTARGGRGKKSFFNTLIDINADKVGDKMTNGFGTKEDIAKRLILQELIRINRDKNLTENDRGFILGYHGPNGRHAEMPIPGATDMELGIDKLMSDKVLQAIDNPGNPVHASFFHNLDAMAKEFVDLQDAKGKELLKTIIKLNLWGDTYHLIDAEGVARHSGIENFLKDFAFDNAIAKWEFSKTLVGHPLFFKSDADLVKRLAIFSSAGKKAVIQGDLPGHPTVGLPRKVRVVQLSDPLLIDEIHNSIADRNKEILISKGVSEEEAESIVAPYRVSGETEIADGITIISDTFHKNVVQSKGQWENKDDMWFDEYQNNNGSWGLDFTAPHKFMYAGLRNHLDNMTVPDADKNSWTTATRDFAEMFPVVNAIRDLMERENIQIVKLVSATKGVKHDVSPQPINVNGTYTFGNVVVTEQDSRNFVEVQEIGKQNAVKNQIRLSTQFRKYIIENINENATYTGPGFSMNGADLKSFYYDVFEEKQNRAMSELKDSIGFSAFEESLLTGENLVETRNNFIIGLRDLFLKEAEDRNKTDLNTLKQLELVAAENGLLDFSIPITHPVVQSKYENLFFSLISSRVLRPNIKGKEVVQVPAIGPIKLKENGKDVVRDLKFLNDGNAAEVAMSLDLISELGDIKVGEDLSKYKDKLVALGYRNPTSGRNSIASFVLAAALPDNFKKTIVVPGGIVAQQNSDFDFDKVFTLLPEHTKGELIVGDSKKDVSDFTNKELNNALFFISNSISLSSEHLRDTLFPLEIEDREAVSKKFKATQESRNLFDPMFDTDMSERFKESSILIGVYAKGRSMMSVLSHGSLLIDPKRFISYKNEAGRIVELQRIADSAEVLDNIAKDLQVALDAGNKPTILINTNDNRYTAGTKLFLRSMNLPDTESSPMITSLLRMPLVEQWVNLVKEGNEVKPFTPSEAFEKLGIKSGYKRSIKTKSGGKGYSMNDFTLDPVEMGNIIKTQDSKSKLAKGYFKAFYIAWESGQELQDIVDLVNFDAASEKGGLAELQALKDAVNRQGRKRDRGLFQDDILEQILEGEYMRLQASFKKQSDESFLMAQKIGFLGASDAVQNFKTLLSQAAGRNQGFSAREHRMIDRKLFEYAATLPGSPLSKYKTVEFAERLFLKGAGKAGGSLTIDNILNRIRIKYPLLLNNEFVSRLEDAKSNSQPNNRIYNIAFNPGQSLNETLRDNVIADFTELMQYPEHFVDSSMPGQSVEELKDFSELLFANAILTNGFTPGASSYYDVIPFEKFIELGDPQYSREMSLQVQKDPNFFTNPEFLFDMLRNIGTMKIDNQPLVPKGKVKMVKGSKASVKTTDEKGKTHITYLDVPFELQKVYQDKISGTLLYRGGPLPMFVTQYNPKSVHDKTSLYVRISEENVYKKVNHMSLGNQLSEINLVDKNGDRTFVSLVPARQLGLNASPENFAELLRNVKDFVYPEIYTEGSNPDELISGKEQCP